MKSKNKKYNGKNKSSRTFYGFVLFVITITTLLVSLWLSKGNVFIGIIITVVMAHFSNFIIRATTGHKFIVSDNSVNGNAYSRGYGTRVNHRH